jgi:prepilin-type N-terminal cleavage/methylation domain-containing protein
MILIKNRGLTLIEVMVALLIISLVLTPALVLVSNVRGYIATVSSKFTQLMNAKNLLVEMHKQQLVGPIDTSVTKTEGAPATTMTYRLQKPNHQDLKELPALYHEQILSQAGDVLLVTFIFRPEIDEHSKK